jgi:hypothetical protein
MGKEVLAGDHSNDTHVSLSLVRLRHRAVLPRVRLRSTSWARTYACEECFGPARGRYDYPALTRSDIEGGPPSMWRYAPLLPVPPDIASRPTTEPG